jgi:hypothetical protein
MTRLVSVSNESVERRAGATGRSEPFRAPTRTSGEQHKPEGATWLLETREPQAGGASIRPSGRRDELTQARREAQAAGPVLWDESVRGSRTDASHTGRSTAGPSAAPGPSGSAGHGPRPRYRARASSRAGNTPNETSRPSSPQVRPRRRVRASIAALRRPPSRRRGTAATAGAWAARRSGPRLATVAG